MTADSADPAQAPHYDRAIVNDALSCVRSAIAGKIGHYLDARAAEPGAYAGLYRLLRDYPFRQGKMLRPAMCIATARALGAPGHAALTVATALELYHNAFLIHDDIEDGSESRRGAATLHRQVGVARAINAGDATNVMSVGLLLENLSVVGVAKALHLLHEIELMARQSAEGQAMELDWVNDNVASLSDADYVAMCTKKTCWYSFITPLRAGLIVGWPVGAREEIGPAIEAITRFGLAIGIAFQVQDDLLNLTGEAQAYGKEIGGDLYEGKRTLMLNHVLRESPRPRRTPGGAGHTARAQDPGADRCAARRDGTLRKHRAWLEGGARPRRPGCAVAGAARLPRAAHAAGCRRGLALRGGRCPLPSRVGQLRDLP